MLSTFPTKSKPWASLGLGLCLCTRRLLGRLGFRGLGRRSAAAASSLFFLLMRRPSHSLHGPSRNSRYKRVVTINPLNGTPEAVTKALHKSGLRAPGPQKAGVMLTSSNRAKALPGDFHFRHPSRHEAGTDRSAARLPAENGIRPALHRRRLHRQLVAAQGVVLGPVPQRRDPETAAQGAQGNEARLHSRQSRRELPQLPEPALRPCGRSRGDGASLRQRQALPGAAWRQVRRRGALCTLAREARRHGL